MGSFRKIKLSTLFELVAEQEPGDGGNGAAGSDRAKRPKKVLQLMENSIERPVDRNWLCSAKFERKKKAGDRRRQEAGVRRRQEAGVRRRQETGVRS